MKLLIRDIEQYNAFPMEKYFNIPSSDSTGVPVNEFRRWSPVVDCSSHHVRFHRNSTFQPRPDEIPRRGSISTFSRHSRLRLREALADASLAASSTWGITLTVPWQQTPCRGFSCVLPVYKACFNRFGVYFRRRFPSSAAIFRHELQRRKMPHCHIVAFFHHSDIEGVSASDLQSIVYTLWLRALNGFLGGGSLLAFSRHGVKVDYLADRDAMFRYISDHTSKSKQAQLGYKGKQWGYIKKSLLSDRVKISYRFRYQADMYFFQRHISKACRFYVKASCVFGRKLSNKTNGVSIQFVKGSTVRKLIRYISKYRSGVFKENCIHKVKLKSVVYLPPDLFSVSQITRDFWYTSGIGELTYASRSIRRVYQCF